MRKWQRLHLTQRRRSISRSSWCMSRNKVMFSSGLEESLSRILRSSSFCKNTSDKGGFNQRWEMGNVRAKCLISLLSASFHWSNHRTQTHEIWENLAPASKNIWELDGNRYGSIMTEVMDRNRNNVLIPRGSEIEVDKIGHRILCGGLEGGSPPGLIGSQIRDQVVFLDGRENWCWAVFWAWNRTITQNLLSLTSQSGDFRKIVTLAKMMIVFCLVFCWDFFWRNFFRPRPFQGCHLSLAWPFHLHSYSHH